MVVGDIVDAIKRGVNLKKTTAAGGPSESVSPRGLPEPAHPSRNLPPITPKPPVVAAPTAPPPPPPSLSIDTLSDEIDDSALLLNLAADIQRNQQIRQDRIAKRASVYPTNAPKASARLDNLLSQLEGLDDF
jgi:hypothetical protein